jgi:hypothetical protein
MVVVLCVILIIVISNICIWPFVIKNCSRNWYVFENFNNILLIRELKSKKKGKAISVTGHEGP